MFCNTIDVLLILATLIVKSSTVHLRTNEPEEKDPVKVCRYHDDHWYIHRILESQRTNTIAGFICQICVPVQNQDLDFYHHMPWPFFFMLNGLSWEILVELLTINVQTCHNKLIYEYITTQYGSTRPTLKKINVKAVKLSLRVHFFLTQTIQTTTRVRV